MANEEILTPMEKRRLERNKHIIDDFRMMNPKIMERGFRPYRTLSLLAKRYNMTPAGVRYILTTQGVINSLSELTEEKEEKL